MAIDRDGVVAAFQLIIEEIESVAQNIADQGGDAFRRKDYEKAQILGESGKNLEAFRARVAALLDDWQAGIDIDTRKRFLPTERRIKKDHVTAHEKAPKSTLRVTLPTGDIVEEYFAADTFALAIKALGIDKVRSLNITETGIPLIDSTKHPQYSQRKVDGWYICTHSNTHRKKEVLERIAKKLGVRIKIEVQEAEPG
ncbi:MAG: hypothetical protein ABSA97_09045 [Verrucomicrobiia bacterium]